MSELAEKLVKLKNTAETQLKDVGVKKLIKNYLMI